ncbi:MAG: hypothetical protein PF904_10855 [Kiritimatiellae bacterium]|jgi:hypothetical protein|nr:hypothetical protein [Kiritimatiellia bacterium]
MGKYSKQRNDSWAAPIAIEDQWKIYHKFRIYSWQRLAYWIAKEHGIEAPSRSALYRWRDYMRSQESSRRIENAVIAQAQTGEIAAATGMKDAVRIDAYKALAGEMALNGNIDNAVKYTGMALALAAQQTKSREMELKAAAQETRDEALQLAREKFMFDAVKAAIKHVETIKSIVQDNNLDEDEQILAVRKKLFGEEVPQ